MSDQADTLIIKPTSIEINNQSNGTIHENGNHSPSKSLKVKIANEKETETIPTATNGHHPPAESPAAKTTTNDPIYETPTNIDHPPPPSQPSSFETPTVSSSDDQGNKADANSQLSSTPPPHEDQYNHGGLDSGLSSEMTNANNSGTETEKTIFDDESSSTSGIASSSIMSAARLLETNIPELTEKRESSPTSGVIIPEEKRVTDRVKVFEAAANHDQSTLKKQATKNGNPKKSPVPDQKQNGKREPQISPSSTSTTDSVDTQATNESKPSTTTTTTTTNTSKNKSKRPSLVA